MTHDQWQHAIQPKVLSSLNLHTHLPNLSFFVMLSSMTGVAGHVSQANYSSGNTFQDALARHRVSNNLPAVALDLPGVSDVGVVATKDAGGDNRIRARVEALGLLSLEIGTIMPIIEAAVLGNPLRADKDDAQVMVGIAPWDALPEDSVIRQDRRFRTLQLASPRGAATTTTSGTTATSPTALLVQALAKPTTDEQNKAVAEAVAKRLSVIFNVAAEEVDLAVPMAVHGVDSLVAVELRNWLAGAAKAKISIFEITQSQSLVEFAGLVGERSQLVK